MKSFLRRFWPIITVCLIAAIFRLYRISDYMEFLGDQGRDVVIVRDFLKNGNLFFIGPQTSIGNMYLGPFYYYLFVAPGLLLFNFNPVGPAVIVALLGIATVYLVYLISSKWFGRSAALISSLLYALSPVVIKYSDFSWNPNVMPLFALLFVYFIVENRYLPASLAFIICLNSHFLSLLLLPLVAIIWIKNLIQSQHRPQIIKHTLFAITIFILSLVPQILFDIRHHGQNLNAIIAFFAQRETTVSLLPYKAIPLIPALFDQVNTRLLAAKYETFGLIISLFFAVLLVFDLIRQYRSRNLHFQFITVLLWLLIGLTGLALYKQHIYDHYFGFLYPAVFLLFGYLLSRLPNFVLITSVIILVIASLSQNPLRYPAPGQLATTRKIVSSIIDASNSQPFNFALLAKMNYDSGYRYFLDMYQAPVKLLDNTITDQLFVVCEPFQIDCNPINNPEWSVAAFGWAKIDSSWEINGINIFRLIHNPDGIKED